MVGLVSLSTLPSRRERAGLTVGSSYVDRCEKSVDKALIARIMRRIQGFSEWVPGYLKFVRCGGWRCNSSDLKLGCEDFFVPSIANISLLQENIDGVFVGRSPKHQNKRKTRFGTLLAIYRLQAGNVDQPELKEMLEESQNFPISISTINKYEWGDLNPTPKFIYCTVRCLGLNEEQERALLNALFFDMVIKYRREYDAIRGAYGEGSLQ